MEILMQYIAEFAWPTALVLTVMILRKPPLPLKKSLCIARQSMLEIILKEEEHPLCEILVFRKIYKGDSSNTTEPSPRFRQIAKSV